MCTLGPATENRLADLIAAGMDVARLNFSHGDHADHQRVYRAVRDAADAVGRTVAVLADLQGPKIRLGRFTDGPVDWHAGDTVRITVDDVPGTPDRVSTTYTALPPMRSRATACSSTTAASGWRSSTSRDRTSSAR